MSDEKKKKTIEDLSENIRSVLRTESVDGDTRKRQKKFRRGHTFIWDGYDRPFTLTEDVMMDVTEEYKNGKWVDKSFHVDTTKTVSEPKEEEEDEPELGRWARLKLWLFGPRLPRARLVR